MVNDDVRGKLIEIADDTGSSLHELRRLWIGEMYEFGCLTHEKYLLLMNWIEAEEAVEMIDGQILESRQALFIDRSSSSPAANE